MERCLPACLRRWCPCEAKPLCARTLCLLQTTTEKQLRRQLGEHFGVDLSDRKAAIRELVGGLLAGLLALYGRNW